MPKAKYADRGKVKPKSIKSTAKLSGTRALSRLGKKLKKGTQGAVSEYIPRTRAIKRLQITLRDFRRLCILKGIYPRDPKNKKHLDPTQTYYHAKDIQYLSHEPLMRKLHTQKIFMRRLKRAVGRRELDVARRMYASRPTYTLDHLVKERYPRFSEALNDLDDALSLVHLFSAFPASPPIKPEHTASALRLSREWQYFVARSHSLRKVFFSIKGIYYQAQVKGINITWLVPWAFSQALPSDVDYKVMLTFLELHETILKFTLFKLYHSIGLAYPPRLRVEAEASGAHLTAIEAVKEGDEEQAAVAAAAAAAAGGRKKSSGKRAAAAAANRAAAIAASAAGAGGGAAGAAAGAVPPNAAARRLATLQARMLAIAGAAGATGEEGSTPPAVASITHGTSSSARASTSLYDFVELDAAGGVGGVEGGGGADAAVTAMENDMAEFKESAEARATVEKARAVRAFQGLFRGLVFFLGREVPRDAFEFIVCSFGARVGYDGPGSPYDVNDVRVTHMVWDRPYEPSPRVEGREYVQPQWVADSINAGMLLPISKYAPSAVLPPHLSPFVDDAAEGYVPSYRQELDTLRAAAAVTGRLADLTEAARIEGGGGSGVRRSRMGDAADAEDGGDSGDEEEGGEGGEEELDEEGEDEEGEENEEDEEDEEDDPETLMQAAGLVQGHKAPAAAASSAHGSSSGGGGAKKRARLEAGAAAAEEERRSMAAAMLSRNARKAYDAGMSAKRAAADAVGALEAKRRAAANKGDKGVGAANAAGAAAAAAAAQPSHKSGGGGHKRPRSG